MKRTSLSLTLLFVTLLVVGCSNIKFDSMQYDRFVTIYEFANNLQTKCGTPDLVRQETNNLQKYVNHMSLYAEFRSNNPELQRSTKALLDMVQEFGDKYTGTQAPSVPYCTEKLNNIASGAKVIASTLGAQ